jgi:hypothetical protein
MRREIIHITQRRNSSAREATYIREPHVKHMSNLRQRITLKTYKQLDCRLALT